VHIQTEEDLQHHSSQQQQQPDATGATQPSQQQQQQQQHGQTTAPGKQGTGLVGKLSSQRLPLGNFGRHKAATASSSSSKPMDAKHPSDASCAAQESTVLVKVQLLVLSSTDMAGVNDQQLVQLLLQVQPLKDTQPVTPSKAGASSSSSSKLLGAGADAVKGLLQGLQHSAAAGLHQSAAAGQELTGAVAAAGEAVVGAMITQPFAAVKGFAARAGGSRKAPAAAGHAADSSSAKDSSPAVPSAFISAAQQGTAGSSTGAAAAAAATPEPSGKRLSSLFSRRQGSATAAAAHADESTSSLVTAQPGAESNLGNEPVLLHVQLRVTADAASDKPVQLVLTPVDAKQAAAGAAATAASRASSSQAPRWHSRKGLLGKFQRSSSNRNSLDSQQQGSSTEAAAAAVDVNKGDEEYMLEGDMWSVMTRLKQGGIGKTGRQGAASPAPPNAAAAAEALAAAQQQLQQEGLQLLQQLLDTCEQVQRAAAACKGSLGDDSEPLLLLVLLVQQALNHGLRNTQAAAAREQDSSSSGKAAAAARDVLGGWLPRQGMTAFGVSAVTSLQAQHYCVTSLTWWRQV
jgi:hypothetical protein